MARAMLSSVARGLLPRERGRRDDRNWPGRAAGLAGCDSRTGKDGDRGRPGGLRPRFRRLDDPGGGGAVLFLAPGPGRPPGRAVPRPRGLARGGPSPGLTEVPRGLRAVAVNNKRLAERYLVAAACGDPAGGARSWADRLLTADFAAWLLDQPYGDRGAEATGFQLQGGLACVYAAGWPGTADALDAFRDRADRIAAAVQQATRSVVQ
jgi:hypothetical protein